MSDTMISAKAVVDAVPSGRQYLSEFYCKENLSDKSSDSPKYTSSDFWRSWCEKGLFDEIYISNNNVVWSHGTEISDSFPKLALTLNTPVIDAFKASFFLASLHSGQGFVPHINKDVPGRVQEGICVFESERMTFIDDWGEHYTVRIPCRLADAWALNTLVLLERQPNNCEVTRDMPNAKTENPCPLFSMFSLTHPLDEVAPVILKVPLSSGGFGIGFVTDVNLKVIGIIPSLNMVLTYHSITKSHAVWQLEKALSQDYAYLYQMDANGCISVATHALTGLIYHSESTKHPGKSDETQVTFDERSICSPNPDVCLSPFAVSLSRLRKNEAQSSQLSYHVSFQSPFHSPAVPFTPANLNTYTNRLSNITPGNTLNYAPSTLNNSGSFHTRRTPIMDPQPTGSSYTPKPTSTIHTQKYSPLNLTTLQGRLSSIQAALCHPNQCETSVQTEKFSPLDADQIANLLDEPLLPKVCLRLVWSEPPSTRSFSTPVNPSCVSPMKHASNFTKENSKYCAPSSGRFALLSRRLPDLPFPLPKTEKPCNNSSSIRNRGEMLSTDPDTSHLAVIQDNSPTLPCHKYGPMKSPAFLAVDLISVSWICFLTSSPGLDDRQCRLACLRINDEETALCTSDNKRMTDDYQAVFGDLTYLRACDAVYVPYSRITICLDPGVGIVLYTGIRKLCLLGLSPPPILSLFLAVGGPQVVKSRLQRVSSDVQLPFIVRPSPPDIDRWHQNAVHSILSKCVSTVTSSSVFSNQVHMAAAEFNSNTKIFCFNELPKDLANVRELYPKQGSDHLHELNHADVDSKLYGENYTSNKRMELKSVEKISICDPAGNAFTIVNDGRIKDVNGDTSSLSSNQLLRVYLPSISENEMVQRCLTSLNQCLSEDVGLLLFTRWYVVSNVPGTNSSYQFQGDRTHSHEDMHDSDAYYFQGCVEWNRFANFILMASGLSLSHRYSGGVTAMESSDGGEDIGEYLQRNKRQRQGIEGASESDWNNLVDVLEFKQDDAVVHPSLLLPEKVTSVVKTYDKKLLFNSSQMKTIHLSRIRDDPDSHLILSCLPTIFFSFHLTYEEAKLNAVLQDKLKQLIELNYILARILNLPAYATYYEDEYSDLCNISLIIHVNFPTDLFKWPDGLSTNIVPCLLTWITKQLELFNSKETSVKLTPYPHLAGVNDLATALAGVIVSALSTEKLKMFNATDKKLAVRHLLEFWSNHIFTWKTVAKLNSSVYGYSHEKQDDFPVFKDEEVQRWLQNAGPFACAYVETLLTSLTLSDNKTLHETDIPCLQGSSQHLALLFLSRLESSSTIFRGVLSRRLRVLPSGVSMILRIFLSLCRLHPPPNCDPHVYSLMGRTDLAKQANILNDYQNTDSSSSCSNSTSSKSEPISFTKQQSTTSCTADTSSWSIAERWSNLVHPLRDTGSMSRNMAVSSHALLYHLESNPCCQVSFKDDLRLREAYRLLQSFSHIRLPRVNSEDPVSSSPSNASGSDLNARLTEARLEMHLAAAGIRVWASVVGRGMLTLGILMGSKVPTQLRVPSICLRGRAVSPTSGRRVLVDLAREPLGSANLNPGANRTPGVADVPIPGLDVSGNAGDRHGLMGTHGMEASNHPGNSMALAIASSVAYSGAGASLRTASLGLSRMVPRNNSANNYANSNVSTTATNSASSTASLLSTANIQHSPSVLAARHWPDFHNGVAIGLSISPHASIDATWIMYNCRAAGLSSTNSRRNNQDSTSCVNTPSPEQAGLLYGLGLNGHLNKVTPYDIREYLVRVHDLHNMAVLLGLCAGKRGTMDQSILRLIAVHYRPLLPFDPLINVQLNVPNLCQAAAVFGLGLLYQGSAHRHITNLLINELGRSLSEDPYSNSTHTGLNSESDSQQTTSNSSNNHPTSNPIGWTGAGGSGGFAGDSCELMALSAGLALGLVLLQKGDSSCGLSDLHWAEKLHAYISSGPRNKISSVPEKQQYNTHLPWDLHERHLPSQRLRSRGGPRRPTDQSRRPNQTGSETANPESNIADVITRGGISHSSGTNSTSSLLLHSDYTAEPLLDPERFLSNDYLYDMTEARPVCSLSRQITPRGRRSSSTTFSATPPSVPHTSGRFSSAVSELAGRLDDYPTKTTWKNPQIRDLNCYNADVSAPGAMMALGMAYLGSGNSTVSSWLLPPSSLHQLELIRPDLLLFQALAYGLINWNSIEPTQEWIESYVPEKLFEKLSESIKPRPKVQQSDISDIRATLGQTDLSSEDDVENRCPDQTFTDSFHTSGRASSNRGRRGSVNNVRGRPVRRSRRYDIRQWAEEGNNVNQIKPDGSKNECLDEFGLHDVDPVDIESISLAYLNILVGCALAMGLRYAGTSNASAANTLYSLSRSILEGTWWPPSSCTYRSPSQNNSFDTEHIKVSLPKPTLYQSAAQCLLALAMILAGSGNLDVLRMVRQLRAIRLFSAKLDTSNSGSDSLYYTVTTAAARAAATTQTAASGSGGASIGGPVSVASVFGAALGPSFALQMLYANTVGLLFLGGGRLTLANTPEAVAMLVISFFPLLPTYAGDNWYHLQALRHLYALATIPRRVCAVDVDTGRVVLSDLQAKLRGSDVMLTTKDTFIFPSDVMDKITWLEINHNSEEYWPTVFHHGTNNWNLFKKTFFEAGYIFVKKRDDEEELNVLKSWLDECLKHWLDLSVLKQLKLLVAFLKCFPLPNNKTNKSKSPHSTGSTFISSLSSTSYTNLGRILSMRVTQHFVEYKDELSAGLRNYYFNPPSNEICVNEHSAMRSRLVKAFRLWFSLPDSDILSNCLPKDGVPSSLVSFLSIVKQHCPKSSIPNMLWLHRFLYPSSQMTNPLS
ncbi:unnamed protein product [Trichobilharzia szidati]|nr:unnamed protein product [Trichobilharzia szidati]